jgi:hypothetical protein
MVTGTQRRVGTRYPLLVYRFIARRYRPAAQVMVLAGLIAQIPWFVPEARLEGTILGYRELALLGLLLMLIGAALWVASIYRVHRAYVQCLPDYLLIRTAGSRTAVAYPRLTMVKSEKVSALFNRGELRGGDLRLIRPLMGEIALEIPVSEFPFPDKVMRRRLNRFVFSPREKGFVFIVAGHMQLATEIDTFLNNYRSARDQSGRDRYLDPIERAKFARSAGGEKTSPFTRE